MKKKILKIIAYKKIKPALVHLILFLMSSPKKRTSVKVRKININMYTYIFFLDKSQLHVCNAFIAFLKYLATKIFLLEI